MTDEEIHNIYLHMSGKAEGLVEANGTADFPVLFARAILEYEGLTKDVQNMASESTYKEQVETKDEPVAWMSEDEHTVYTSKQVDGCFQHDHIPLYTTPQFKGCDECGNGGGYALYCVACAEKYVKPEWVGLNGADWNDFNPLLVNDPHRIAEWVERILKDKNT